MSKNGFMTLNKSHWQKFVKRLRFNMKQKGNKNVVKYYAVGEYGTKRFRPHFHAIMFGVDISDVQDAWDQFSETDMATGEVMYRCGHVDVGTVTGASIGYTLKYMHKGRVVPAHPRDDRVPEFSMMSKRLGDGYLNDESIKYHRSDSTRVYLTNPDGFKVSMPRYYREKIWPNSFERRAIGKKVAEKHEQDEQARKDAYVQMYGSLDGYDFAVHEAKKQMINNFKKKANENRKDV